MTEAAPVRTVAVLGTGHMGTAMSRALAGAGFDLVLYNRTPSRAEPLAAELGARVVNTAAEAVAAADMAISMVADEGAVAELYRGTGGAGASRRDAAGCAGVGQHGARPIGRAHDHGRR